MEKKCISKQSKDCLRCKRIIIEDFEKWKEKNPKQVFEYCKKCRMFTPVMRSEGIDI